MFPYYVFLLCLCSLALFHIKKGKDGKVIMFFLWFSLTLFAGLRYNNPDWQNYSDLFKLAKIGSTESPTDNGFYFIIKTITYFTDNSIWMFIVIASIAILLNFKSFKQYTPYLFLAILLYFVHNFVLKEMIQMRVGLASSICLYSIYYLKQNNYKKTLILWLIAVSIHLTVAIFGMVILLYKFQPNKRFLFFSLILSLIIGTVCPLGSLLKKQIGIDDRLDEYIAYGDNEYGEILGIWNNLNVIKTLVFFLLLLYFFDKINNKNKYFYPLFISYTVGLCWMICFNDFAIIGARMSNILLSGECVLLTYPLLVIDRKYCRSYQISLITLAVLIFSLNISPDKITPYKFYLTHCI